MRDENLSQLHTITACESGTLPELERTPKANWDTPKATWDTRAKSAARPTEQSWPSTRSVQADARRRASLSAGCRPPMPLRPTTWLVLLPRRGAHDTRLAVFGWRTLLNNRTHAAEQPHARCWTTVVEQQGRASLASPVNPARKASWSYLAGTEPCRSYSILVLMPCSDLSPRRRLPAELGELAAEPCTFGAPNQWTTSAPPIHQTVPAHPPQNLPTCSSNPPPQIAQRSRRTIQSQALGLGAKPGLARSHATHQHIHTLAHGQTHEHTCLGGKPDGGRAAFAPASGG